MAQRPELSKSELEIARIVWDLGEGSVRQVHEALPANRGADFTTVQTWLRRLEQKGYLKTRLEGRIRIYAPRVRPQTVIRETVNGLVGRLFAGEAMPLIQHLIEDGGISRDEIAHLRSLLNRLENEKAKGGRSDQS